MKLFSCLYCYIFCFSGGFFRHVQSPDLNVLTANQKLNLFKLKEYHSFSIHEWNYHVKTKAIQKAGVIRTCLCKCLISLSRITESGCVKPFVGINRSVLIIGSLFLDVFS